MNTSVSHTDLFRLKEFLSQQLGLNILERQDGELINKIQRAAYHFGQDNISEFISNLSSNFNSMDELGELSRFVTVGETYFMREKKGFDFLENKYLPDIINNAHRKKQLRIWCAGCASGEEAYSLAITIHRSVPEIKKWNISIIATDINPQALEKARNAEYSKWSFRNNTPAFIKKYFIEGLDSKYRVIPDIKQMVAIKQYNLASNSYQNLITQKSPFDIVFCRNVMIYFSGERINRITDQIYDILAPNGVLVVSPVEVSSAISSRFEHINYEGLTIFRKGCQPISPVKNEQFATSVKGEATHTVNRNQTPTLPFQSGIYSHKDYTSAKKTIEEKANTILDNQRTQESLMRGKQVRTNNREEKDLPIDENLLQQAKEKADKGLLGEAEILCEKAINQDRLNPGCYYLLATVKHEQGNKEMALSLVKKAIYLDPDFVLAHFLLGTISLNTGDINTGKKSIRNALRGLSKLSNNDIVPESEGLTVARFKEILQSITT